MMFVPEEEPSVSVPVCAVPPIVMVPVVVAAPIAYVEAPAPFRLKLPVPTRAAMLDAPVEDPIVMTSAEPVAPIAIVFAQVPEAAILTV